MTVAVVFVGTLIAVEVADEVTGCGSIDPADPANYSTIHILNNTPRPVLIDDCVGAYCDPDQLPRLLQPGQVFTDAASCGASGKDMTSWKVTDPGGRVLGFVAVDSPRSVQGLLFDVTSASEDRTTATPST